MKLINFKSDSMTKHFTLATICLLTTTYILGQTNCDSIQNPKLVGNSFQCNWIYFNLTEEKQGIILKHDKQLVKCGILATASLTIVKLGKDTIRVIDQCNTSNYKKGQKIKIFPTTEPPFQVHIPYYLDSSVSNITKRYFLRSNLYDEIVVKTTWANIQLDK